MVILLSAASAATAKDVVLAWDANPEPDIAAYIVQYGTESGVYTQTQEVGIVTTATLAQLAPGNYYSVVIARNTAGLESLPSDELNFPVFPPITFATSSLAPGRVGAPYLQSIQASGGSGTLSYSIVGGTLPTGLTLNSDGTLIGTPTAVQSSSFTVQALDSEMATSTAEFLISVAPQVPPQLLGGDALHTSVGNSGFQQAFVGSDSPTMYAAKGLPRGISLDLRTGTLSGRASQAGSYSIQVRAGNAAGWSAWTAYTLIVDALSSHLIGTFYGTIARNALVNANLGGSIKMTVSSSGAITGTVTQGQVSRPFRSILNTSGESDATAEVQIPWIGFGNLKLTTSITGAGLLNGVLASNTEEASIEGWRNAWNVKKAPASDRVGYYTVALDLSQDQDVENSRIPQGNGFAGVMIQQNGSVRVVGKTADGTAFGAGSFMGEAGQLTLYRSLYRGAGSILGKLTVSANVVRLENKVEGGLTWLKPASRMPLYPEGFGPIAISVAGKYMAPDAKHNALTATLLPNASATVKFSQSGMVGSSSTPDVTFTYLGANRVLLNNVGRSGSTLILNPATGAFSGTFHLGDSTTAQKGRYAGLVVRVDSGDLIGAGYFLLPVTTDASLRTAPLANILSGQVRMEK